MNLCTLDIILLICFIPALITGFRKGIVEQVTSIIALVAGIYLAFLFSSALSSSLAPSFEKVSPKVIQIVSFILIAIAVCLIIKLIGNLFAKLLKGLSLGWINRLFGLFFSIFTAAIILGLLIVLFESLNTQFELIDPSKYNNSTVYTSLRGFAEKIFPFLKSLIANV